MEPLWANLPHYWANGPLWVRGHIRWDPISKALEPMGIEGPSKELL